MQYAFYTSNRQEDFHYSLNVRFERNAMSLYKGDLMANRSSAYSKRPIFLTTVDPNPGVQTKYGSDS